MSRAAPLVTIGIPFYNAAGTLRAAIRSVFAQTCGRWELILLDDGSTHDSLVIARSVNDARVRVLSDGQNRQLGARLNEINQLARAPLVARMDADDIMHPERIARQVTWLEDNEKVDVLGTAAFTIDGAGRPKGIRGDAAIVSATLDVFGRGL